MNEKKLREKISNKQFSYSMIILFVFMIVMATIGKVLSGTWNVFYVVVAICIGFPICLGMIRFWEWVDNKVEKQVRENER